MVRRPARFLPATSRAAVLVAIAVLALVTISRLYAQQYVEQEVRIPWVQAGGSGLDALLVYVNMPGRHPLVLMTHGSPRDAAENRKIDPWQELPQALWFARRGWIVLVVTRRGYGNSGGEPDSAHGERCPGTDYQAVGETAAQDLNTAIDYARKLPMVDATRILAVGVSSGGFATVALTAEAPRGLVAAISFAGGRGSKADHDVCNPGDLIHAFEDFGKTSRVPMLWLYAQNDQFFWPDLAQKLDQAFRSKGGQDQLVIAPPIDTDGHRLFSHVNAWSATVDAFLQAHNLQLLPALLPELQPPNLAPPAGLDAEGLGAFHNYLLRGPHKAFAVSASGWGMAVAENSTQDAANDALQRCKKSSGKGERCAIAYLDEAQPQR